MKRILLGMGGALLALSMSATAQMHGGQGPKAWGDKNKDGKCDMTGKPVGQGRGGQMAAGQQCNGCGHGHGHQGHRGGRGQAAQTPAPEAEAKK